MRLRLGHGRPRLLQPKLLVLGLHLPLNVWLQARLQQLQRLAYPVVIADRHCLFLFASYS